MVVVTDAPVVGGREGVIPARLDEARSRERLRLWGGPQRGVNVAVVGGSHWASACLLPTKRLLPGIFQPDHVPAAAPRPTW